MANGNFTWRHGGPVGVLEQRNRRPCWCPQLILRELNSILMQTLSFVFMEKHVHWSHEWKRPIANHEVNARTCFAGGPQCFKKSGWYKRVQYFYAAILSAMFSKYVYPLAKLRLACRQGGAFCVWLCNMLITVAGFCLSEKHENWSHSQLFWFEVFPHSSRW